MTVRPGRAMLATAAFLLPVALLSFTVPVFRWAFAAAVVFVTVAAWQDRRVLRQWADGLTVERNSPGVVGRAASFRMELRFTLAESTPSATNRPVVLDVRDETPPDARPRLSTTRITLLPGQPVSWTVPYRIPLRGRHSFGPVWIRLRGPLQMLEGQIHADCTGRASVLPETFASRERLAEDIRAAVDLIDRLVRSREQGVGTEFESLAEFREGDDPRRIDWRATARMRHRVIRRFQIERHRDVMIVVDCGRLMGADAGRGTKLDCAVDSALLLARVALESGDRCGIALFDDRVRGYLPPQSGKHSLRWLSEGVYDVQSQMRESDFGRVFAELQHRQGKRALMIVLSDIADAETSTRFRAALAALTRRHVVLFAALQTPLLRQGLREPVETELQGARQAVALRLLTDRERAIHSLDHSGVHVVDVEPDDLTVALINRFIELRSGNLL